MMEEFEWQDLWLLAIGVMLITALFAPLGG